MMRGGALSHGAEHVGTKWSAPEEECATWTSGNTRSCSMHVRRCDAPVATRVHLPAGLTRRPGEEHSAWHLGPEAAELLGVAQEVNDLLQLALGLVRALRLRLRGGVW